jgi:hypothetical protein
MITIGERYLIISKYLNVVILYRWVAKLVHPLFLKSHKGGLICGSLTTRQYPQIRRKIHSCARVEEYKYVGEQKHYSINVTQNQLKKTS